MRLRGIGVLAAGLLLLSQWAQAEDTAAIKAEIADMKARVAALQASQASGGNLGDAESLTSMKKKGAIKIGGRVDVDLYSIGRDDRTSGSDNVNSTVFTTTTAALFFDNYASPNTFLRIKLDVDDAWNPMHEDDLLEEAYFMWKNVGGTDWGLKFGKAEAPYSLDKDPSIVKSYHHNTGCSCASFLAFAWEQRDGTDTTRNPHSTVGNNRHPGERDNDPHPRDRLSAAFSAHMDMARRQLESAISVSD